ncbi:hypothetical protein NSQ77_08435 [Oceanobacillus sp. FSL K6-2867]
MTQYLYIASSMRLPTGTFGLNPVFPEKVKRFPKRGGFYTFTF